MYLITASCPDVVSSCGGRFDRAGSEMALPFYWISISIQPAFACQKRKHQLTLLWIQYLSVKTLSIRNCYKGWMPIFFREQLYSSHTWNFKMGGELWVPHPFFILVNSQSIWLLPGQKLSRGIVELWKGLNAGQLFCWWFQSAHRLLKHKLQYG